jgi:phosphatidylserine/phosphatidylglycerophosphate/cardiolipin synthase-like enzyme
MVRAVPRTCLPFALVVLAVACSSAELTPAAPVPSTSGDPATPGGGGSSGGDGDGGPGDPGAPLAMSRAVTIQIQPSDSGAALLAAIKGAKKSVHMTMYMLTSNEMIGALVDVKQGGKDVKVVLNKSFPTPDNPNEGTFTTLKNKGVSVVWASSGYTFTHAKTILIDGTKAVISTMNLTYSSPTSNREYIATDTDAQDVADLEEVFDADFAGKAVSLATKLVLSPSSANTLESPRSQLKRLIESAKTSLDVEVEALSDGVLVDAIVAAHQANVDVRVVVDPTTLNTTAQNDAVAKLKQGAVPLRGLKTPDVHAKAIVADGARVFVGSHNFTVNALDANREVGVLTDAAGEAKKVSDAIRGDFDSGADL